LKILKSKEDMLPSEARIQALVSSSISAGYFKIREKIGHLKTALSVVSVSYPCKLNMGFGLIREAAADGLQLHESWRKLPNAGLL